MGIVTVHLKGRALFTLAYSGAWDSEATVEAASVLLSVSRRGGGYLKKKKEGNLWRESATIRHLLVAMKGLDLKIEASYWGWKIMREVWKEPI